MKFDVFLPSLLVSPDTLAGADSLRLPALETLLARGVKSVGREWPHVLPATFSALQSDGAHSLGALAALGDGIDTDTQGCMFAEPAHFQADRDTLNLIPASHLDITAGEAVKLIGGLNENFADRGLKFSFGASGRWYVCCAADELPQTTSLRAARRGALFEKLPQSRGKLSWKAIQNETQMLLFAHPVNVARETAGKLTINGLWFWGEGTLATATDAVEASVDTVIGDTPLASGLARLAKARFETLTDATILATGAVHTHNVVVSIALETSLERGDVKAWQDTARRFETQLFGPLLLGLRDGTIDELVLTLPRDRDSLVVRLDQRSLRGISGWWKSMFGKPRPFLESAIA